MLIFRGTFKVSKTDEETFLEWLRNSYLPEMYKLKIFYNILMVKKIDEEERLWKSYHLSFYFLQEKHKEKIIETSNTAVGDNKKSYNYLFKMFETVSLVRVKTE